MTKKISRNSRCWNLESKQRLKKVIKSTFGEAWFQCQLSPRAATLNNVQDINVVISCLAVGIMENPFDFGLSSAQIQAFDWGLEAKFKSFHLIFPNFIVLQFFSAASLPLKKVESKEAELEIQYAKFIS